MNKENEENDALLEKENLPNKDINLRKVHFEEKNFVTSENVGDNVIMEKDFLFKITNDFNTTENVSDTPISTENNEQFFSDANEIFSSSDVYILKRTQSDLSKYINDDQLFNANKNSVILGDVTNMKAFENIQGPSSLSSQDVGLDSNASIPLSLSMRSSGLTSPVRSRNLKEYEEQLEKLKKENFDLKARIYLMGEKRGYNKLVKEDKKVLIKNNLDLKAENENLKRNLETKEKKASEVLSRSKEAENKYQTLIEHEREQNRVQNKKFNEQIEQLQNELENRKHNSKDEVKDLTMLCGLAFDGAQNSALDATDTGLNSTLSAGKKRISEREQEVQQLKAKVEILENEVKEGQTQVLALKEDAKHLKKEIEDKDDKLNDLEVELIEKDQRVDQLMQDLETRHLEIADKNHAIQNLNNDLDKVGPQIEVKVQEIMYKERIIEEKEVQLEQQNKILVEIQITLDEKQKLISDLEDNLETSRKETKEIKEKFQMSSHTIQTMLDEKSSKEKELNSLKNEVKKGDARARSLLAELKEALDMLRKAKWEAENNSSFEHEYSVKEMTDDENERLWAELEKRKEDNKKLQGMNENLSKELKEIKTQENETKKLLGEVRDREKELVEQKLETEKKIEELEREIKNLKHDKPSKNNDSEKEILVYDNSFDGHVKISESSDNLESSHLSQNFVTLDNPSQQRLYKEYLKYREAARQFKVENNSLRERLSESRVTCDMLRNRLEELVEFLEQILEMERKGFLSLSHLSNDQRSFLHKSLNDSRALSLSITRSFMLDPDTIFEKSNYYQNQTQAFSETNESDSIAKILQSDSVEKEKNSLLGDSNMKEENIDLTLLNESLEMQPHLPDQDELLAPIPAVENYSMNYNQNFKQNDAENLAITTQEQDMPVYTQALDENVSLFSTIDSPSQHQELCDELRKNGILNSDESFDQFEVYDTKTSFISNEENLSKSICFKELMKLCISQPIEENNENGITQTIAENNEQRGGIEFDSNNQSINCDNQHLRTSIQQIDKNSGNLFAFNTNVDLNPNMYFSSLLQECAKNSVKNEKTPSQSAKSSVQNDKYFEKPKIPSQSAKTNLMPFEKDSYQLEQTCPRANSETWSEPDRNASIARIGIDISSNFGSANCSKDLKNQSRDNSNVLSEYGATSDDYAPVPNISPKYRKNSDKIEFKKLESKIKNLQDLNDSLKTELGLCQILRNELENPSTSGCESSPPENINRQNISSTLLEEIHCLRIKLEEAISRNDALHDQLQVGISTCFDTNLQVGDLQNRLCERNLEIGDLNERLSEKRLEVRDLKERLSDKNLQLSDTKRRLQSSEAKENNLNAKIVEYDENLYEMGSSLADHIKTNQKLELKRQNLEKELRKCKIMVRDSEVEMLKLLEAKNLKKEKVNFVEGELKKLKESLDEKNKEISDYRNLVHDLNEAKLDCEKKLEVQECAINELTESIKSITVSNEKASLVEQSIQNLKETLVLTEKKLLQSTKDGFSLANERAVLKSQLASAKLERNVLERHFDEFIETINDLVELPDLNDSNEVSHENIEQKAYKNNNNRVEYLRRIISVIKEMRVDKIRLLSEHDGLQSQVENLRTNWNELETLKTTNAEIKNLNNELIQKITILEAKIFDLKGANVELEKANETLKDKIISLNQVGDFLKEKLSVQNQENFSIQCELTEEKEERVTLRDELITEHQARLTLEEKLALKNQKNSILQERIFLLMTNPVAELLSGIQERPNLEGDPPMRKFYFEEPENKPKDFVKYVKPFSTNKDQCKTFPNEKIQPGPFSPVRPNNEQISADRSKLRSSLSQYDYEKLRKIHVELSKQFKELEISHSNLMTQNRDLENRLESLLGQNVDEIGAISQDTNFSRIEEKRRKQDILCDITDHKILQSELDRKLQEGEKLKVKLKATEKSLDEAMEKLSHVTRRKTSVEKEACKQLSKTRKVLEKANENFTRQDNWKKIDRNRDLRKSSIENDRNRDVRKRAIENSRKNSIESDLRKSLIENSRKNSIENDRNRDLRKSSMGNNRKTSSENDRNRDLRKNPSENDRNCDLKIDNDRNRDLKIDNDRNRDLKKSSSENEKVVQYRAKNVLENGCKISPTVEILDSQSSVDERSSADKKKLFKKT